jgi:YebC/PmpR family DNA-binding regulatory protein
VSIKEINEAVSVMAGHSKWANIQHRKNAQDKKRGKLFTKLIREITIAARMGGADAESNPRLRLAIDKALNQNMTKDTIDRARKRGAGGLEGAIVEEIRYEGYGPGGIAVMVDCITDNRIRTVAEVRHIFSKLGGNLGATGSVAYLFAERGVLSFAPGADENRIIEIALEAGADDVSGNEDGSMEVYTSPENFAAVKDAMLQAKLEPAEAEVTMVPATYVTLDKENAEKMLKLQDMMEDLDDVQAVFSNAEIPPEIYEEIAP